MGTNFPTNLDNFTNPSSTDSLSSPDHATQHADVNDAVEALQAKVGVNNSAVTTSLDYRVRNPSLVGGAARPLLTGGAYLNGTTGLVLSGLSGNYASAPDSAALSTTGDIDLRARISLNDWTPSGDAVVIAKWTQTGSQRSYYFTVKNNGTLQFSWSTDGAAGVGGSATSTVATGVADGATKWVRVTMDVDNGASGRTIEFFLSDDGVTWTQLGATVTQAGTTSIFDSTAIVEFGSHSVGTAPSASGGVWQRAQILSGINGTTVFDANFESQTADALAFRASSNSGIKADGLVLQGRSGEYASTPDSAALDITGDIDIKVKATLTDWTPSGGQCLAGKWRANSLGDSWYFIVLSGGVLRLNWMEGANARSADSTVATGITDGTTKWVRATLDVDDGSSQRIIKFYTSDDGTTWTQLGTTVTQAGATSIFSGDSSLFIGTIRNDLHMLTGTVSRVLIQSAFDTANNTSNLVFDADFDAQPAGTISFNESSSNAALVTVVGCDPVVTINTTRYSFGLPNVDFVTTTSAAVVNARDYYNPFIVTSPVVIDMFAFEVTAAAGSSATMELAIYQADNNLQPTGSPLVTDSISVPNGSSGIFRKQFTGITLQPGTYLIAHNASASLTVRILRGGQTASIGSFSSAPMLAEMVVSRTASTFTSSPLPWNTAFGSSSGAFQFRVFLRWRAA